MIPVSLGVHLLPELASRGLLRQGCAAAGAALCLAQLCACWGCLWRWPVQALETAYRCTCSVPSQALQRAGLACTAAQHFSGMSLVPALAGGDICA